MIYKLIATIAYFAFLGGQGWIIYQYGPMAPVLELAVGVGIAFFVVMPMSVIWGKK